MVMRHSVLDWAAWGAMALTGQHDGPPLAPAAPVATRLAAWARELGDVTGSIGVPVHVESGVLVTGRAARRGLTRQGRTSPGGACRLVPAADGWLAVNLARADDVELLPALLGHD